MTSEEQPRVVKKYPNRRLYDTDASRYITLSEVRELIISEIPLVVIEQKTGEDITRAILLQIILEQESETSPLFTNQNLEQFIRYYGSAPQLGFSEFMAQSLEFFNDQQLELGKVMEGLAGKNPVSILADMTQKNIDAWSQLIGFSSKSKKE
mgnify:CR=1 FL=1